MHARTRSTCCSNAARAFGYGSVASCPGKPPADLEVLIVDAARPVAAPLRKTMMGEQVDHRLGHAGRRFCRLT